MPKKKQELKQDIMSAVDRKIRKAQDEASQRILTLKLGDGGLVAFNSFSYDSACGIFNIATNIAQGSALNQRLANDIRLRKMAANLVIAPGDPYDTVRVLVVASRGFVTSSTTSTFISQVFSGVTGAEQVTAPVDTLSFDVLHDEILIPFFRPTDGSTSASVGVPKHSSFTVDLGNRLVTYNQGNSALAGKPVWLILVSDSLVAPHAGCVHAGIRVEFTTA